MRTKKDRIRHALMFELIALAIITPFGGSVFEVSTMDFGVVAVVSTTTAMIWNYVFNLGFDHAMLRQLGTLRKSVTVRVVHAVAFELGLLLLLVPFIAWYLAVPLWTAFVMDVTIAAFYLVYAFAFNWLYDTVFPLPETASA